MLSTATALIQATEDAIFADESMGFAQMLYHNHKEMDGDSFAKAIYLYSGIIASAAVDNATKALLTKTQFQELMASIDELDSMRNSVLDEENN